MRRDELREPRKNAPQRSKATPQQDGSLSQNNHLFARLVKLPTGRAASSVRVRSFVPSIASERGNKSA